MERNNRKTESGACQLLMYLCYFSVCLAASSWPLGHPHSEHHIRNLPSKPAGKK